jgi:hypothetical protein
VLGLDGGDDVLLVLGDGGHKYMCGGGLRFGGEPGPVAGCLFASTGVSDRRHVERPGEHAGIGEGTAGKLDCGGDGGLGGNDTGLW